MLTNGESSKYLVNLYFLESSVHMGNGVNFEAFVPVQWLIKLKSKIMVLLFLADDVAVGEKTYLGKILNI